MNEFTEEIENSELEQLSEELRLQEFERQYGEEMDAHEKWIYSLPQVKVVNYGDYGYKSENPDDCLYGSEGACMSRSSGSLCGCNQAYGGEAGKATVYCSGVEELNRMKLKKSQ